MPNDVKYGAFGDFLLTTVKAVNASVMLWMAWETFMTNLDSRTYFRYVLLALGISVGWGITTTLIFAVSAVWKRRNK